MEIRKPIPEEIQQIRRLSPQALAEGTLGNAEPNRDKVRQLVDPLLKKGCYYLIAAEEKQLAGWVLIGESKDSFTDRIIGFVYELYVLEHFRGRGISRKLMQEAVEQLKSLGYPEVRLSVYAGNHALHLYESLGFAPRTITMTLPL
ncbi:GNAT family N-acetyltransferase [Paenibacillus chitinolyticus]|uniref:GNAT family N-acetyltransferase n=1 Tax=Paenibacillus TaxID=44249 RepID=UPI002DBE77D2|nr:GNAT family N-acetyltransferase [Paenibacillus chitinolyticus]MEC0248002.1 GNAT family N-acetyltransferase [Paenibacillus chitinolyticus]